MGTLSKRIPVENTTAARWSAPIAAAPEREAAALSDHVIVSVRCLVAALRDPRGLALPGVTLQLREIDEQLDGARGWRLQSQRVTTLAVGQDAGKQAISRVAVLTVAVGVQP